MKRLVFCLLLFGICIQLRGQGYCRYCYTATRNYLSKTLTLSNVYSVDQDRNYYLSGQQCYDTREYAELNREKEIESATGYVIKYITETGLGCDENYQRMKAIEQQAAEEEERRKKEREEAAKAAKKRHEELIRLEREKIRKNIEMREAELQQRNKELEQQKLLQEKQEQKDAEATARNLIIQKTRELYEYKGAKPSRIADGWHQVTIIENEQHVYEGVVQVKNNFVISIVDTITQFQINSQSLSPSLIKEGKTLVQIADNFRDIYFMTYISDSTSSVPAPRTGNLVFWTDNQLAGNIIIFIEGRKVGRFAVKQAAMRPVCGDSDGFTVSGLLPGTYTYTAQSDVGGQQWEGSVTIFADECVKKQLTSTIGQVVIGVATPDYFPLSLKINDSQGKRLESTTLQQPLEVEAITEDCAHSSSFTFVAPAGTYSYEIASTHQKKRWMKAAGSIQVLQGNCQPQILTLPEVPFRLELTNHSPDRNLILYLEGKAFDSEKFVNDKYEFSGIFRAGTIPYHIVDKQVNQRISEGEVTLAPDQLNQFSFRSKAAMGQVIFFTEHSRVRRKPIRIFIDGKEIGILTQPYRSGGEFLGYDNPKTLSVELAIGPHTLEAYDQGGWRWKGNIKIMQGIVQRYELKKDGTAFYLARFD